MEWTATTFDISPPQIPFDAMQLYSIGSTFYVEITDIRTFHGDITGIDLLYVLLMCIDMLYAKFSNNWSIRPEVN